MRCYLGIESCWRPVRDEFNRARLALLLPEELVSKEVSSKGLLLLMPLRLALKCQRRHWRLWQRESIRPLKVPWVPTQRSGTSS